jgi:hypothetical protein
VPSQFQWLLHPNYNTDILPMTTLLRGTVVGVAAKDDVNVFRPFVVQITSYLAKDAEGPQHSTFSYSAVSFPPGSDGSASLPRIPPESSKSKVSTSITHHTYCISLTTHVGPCLGLYRLQDRQARCVMKHLPWTWTILEGCRIGKHLHRSQGNETAYEADVL